MKLPSLFKTEARPVEFLAEDPLIVKVWKAPADYNRAARRLARLWGRIWKWDAQALGLNGMAPRYVRRHYNERAFLHPVTRRQRKHKARILRIMGGR